KSAELCAFEPQIGARAGVPRMAVARHRERCSEIRSASIRPSLPEARRSLCLKPYANYANYAKLSHRLPPRRVFACSASIPPAPALVSAGRALAANTQRAAYLTLRKALALVSKARRGSEPEASPEGCDRRGEARGPPGAAPSGRSFRGQSRSGGGLFFVVVVPS